MGFHLKEIKKGTYGEISKIREELEELEDAEEQGIKLMVLFELSDIIGAVAGVAKKYNWELEDLTNFAKLRSKVIEEELLQNDIPSNSP